MLIVALITHCHRSHCHLILISLSIPSRVFLHFAWAHVQHGAALAEDGLDQPGYAPQATGSIRPTDEGPLVHHDVREGFLLLQHIV